MNFYRPGLTFGSVSLIAHAAQLAAALSFIDIPRQLSTEPNRPRDFWKNARYPLTELRRLATERGSGSVRRIDPAVRQTFSRTA